MVTEQPIIFNRFKETVLKYPKNIALGWKTEARYQTMNYSQLLDKVNRCVSGLRKLNIKAGTKVAIFSSNRPEWAILDLALNKIGAISVPIHTTLSPNLIKHILEDSKAEYLALGEFLSKYQEIENQISLKKVISFNYIDWRADFVYFQNFFKEQPDSQEAAVKDYCTIIYTSGTTGKPKGVMLTDDNFIQNIEAALKYVPYYPTDSLLSFLPLSHVLERTGGYYCPLFCGAAVYFAESSKTIAEDIKKVRPTILISVPRIFEKVYEKVLENVKSKNSIKQKIFFSSLKLARYYLNVHKTGSALKIFLKIGYYLADSLVLSKGRAALGGRLRFSISGGAPLSVSVARFFESLGIVVLEGYGLTETSPIISVNPITDYRFGTVGKIISGVEVKIADDKEILTKGHNVMKGYFNNEAATNESFISLGLSGEAESEARWFKTGDLGFLDNENYLTIIGRKKEMIVTATGKNVNPEELENALIQSKYIAQAMVYGDKEKYISALLVPDFMELKKYAEINNIQLELFELLENEIVLEMFKEEVKRYLDHFPDNEKVKNFVLADREFSEEKEELTPTLKLRRKKILDNFNHLFKK